MQTIKLFKWNDSDCSECVREVAVLETQDLTRNGVKRLFAWCQDDDELNFILYPTDDAGGTAYPEYEGRIQMQRHGERFRYIAG